jgi:hypothetical protein
MKNLKIFLSNKAFSTNLLVIITFFLPVVLLIVFTYWELPQTFYQQDEWLGLGQILAQGWSHVAYGFSPLQIIFGDGRPLTRVLGVLLFGNFPLNSEFLAFYSIFFHILNSFLVFLIAYKLLKNRLLALISSLFFAINSVSHQSVTWFGASFGAQPSAFTIFLSILLFITYLENNKKKFFYFSILSALISLYFKETAIFLFAFLPIIEMIYRKDFRVIEYMKKYFPFLFFIISFAIFRLFEMMVVRVASDGILTAKVFSNIGNEYVWQSLIIRFFMYPLTSLSLIFIPVPISLFLGYMMRKIYYPFMDLTQRPDLVDTTAILDLLALVFSFCLIVLIFFMWRKLKKYRFPIIFSLALFVIGILPYIVVAKTFAYMEPRYYYILSAAAGMILALVLFYLFKILKNTLARTLIIILFASLLFSHVRTIMDNINYQTIIAKERRAFISQLYNLVPTLDGSKNIFYVDGSKARFSEHNKAPFQNGIGYTLMVLYYQSGKIPKELMSEGYLWELDMQGYKEIEGKGFGYFYDLETLSEFIRESRIDPNTVIALYYDSSKQKLSDRTEVIRKELRSRDI